VNGSRRPAVPRDREVTAYLGFPLEITATEIVVSTPAGRRVGCATSVKQARLLVRSYRRAMRPGSSSRVERAVGDLPDRALPEDLRVSGGRR